jgi:hypothetical protein
MILKSIYLKTLKSKNVVLSTLESLKQGTLIEGDGSVQLTSSLRQLVVLKSK